MHINISFGPWNKGLTKDTDDRIKRVGESRIGENNPMFGYEYSDAQKELMSKRMKAKIKSGEFTPNIKNSRTHWQSTLNGKKYRSSWEAFFHMLNPEYEYEKLRIDYELADKTRIYIVDFIDYVKNVAVEVKPKAHQKNATSKAKQKALQIWAFENGFEILIIDEDYLFEFVPVVDLSLLDPKSQQLLEAAYATEKKNRNKKT